VTMWHVKCSENVKQGGGGPSGKAIIHVNLLPMWKSIIQFGDTDKCGIQVGADGLTAKTQNVSLHITSLRCS